MKPLSKESEQQVIGAVQRTVTAVDDDGLSPDAALGKEAAALRWGPEMIKFAARAYNVGRQTAQRTNEKTILEKLAEFPLADADKIIAHVYPNTKQAAAASDALGAEHPPAWLGVRGRNEQAQHRTLLKEAGVREKSASQPVQTSGLSPDKALVKYRRHKQAADQSRITAAQAYNRMLTASRQLAGYFKQAADVRMPLATVQSVCGLYWNKESVDKLFNWVAVTNGQDKLDRNARPVKLAAVTFDADEKPYSLVANCIKLAGEVRDARNAEIAERDQLDAFVRQEMAPYIATPTIKRSWNLLEGEHVETTYSDASLRPFLSARPTPPPAPPVKEAGLLDFLSGSAIGASTTGMLDKALGGGDKADGVRSEYNALADPSHDAKLREIRSQAMLTDFMNDPVIAGHDPDKVINAYNEISQMAPRAAQQPLAMRTMMRRYLGGHLEPFEAKEIAGLEKGLMDTSRPVSDDSILGSSDNDD